MTLENIELITVADWKTLFTYRAEVEQAANWLFNNWELNPNLSAELAIAISQTLHAYSIAVWEAWLKKGIEAAKKAKLKNAARRLQRSLGEYYRMRGDIKKAEDYLRASLSTAEKIFADATANNDSEGIDDCRRGVAVTQSSLADLLTTRGQYDEAERLLRSGLLIVEAIHDLQGVGVYKMRLGELAILQNKQEEAIPLLETAIRQFQAISLPNWAAMAVQLLNQATGNILTLDKLVGIVKAARQGETEAGKQAWQICLDLKKSEDENLAGIGSGLLQILAGIPPEEALANLPDELQEQIMKIWQE